LGLFWQAEGFGAASGERWIVGERVFVDCDILQNPDEIERHRACAGDARRIRRSDNDTDNSRRLAQGFNLKISTSTLRYQGFDLKLVTSGLE
jgi:hypothetical protein